MRESPVIIIFSRGFTYVFGVDDVLEVLQSDLSVVADGAAEHVFQPFQILRRELTPGTAIKRRGEKIGTMREGWRRSVTFHTRSINSEFTRESCCDNQQSMVHKTGLQDGKLVFREVSAGSPKISHNLITRPRVSKHGKAIILKRHSFRVANFRARARG